MKKIFLFFSIIGIVNTASAQWISQNIPGNLNFLNGIDFYDAQRGAVGGWGFGSVFSVVGRALYTTNGGVIWNYSIIPDSLRVLIAVQYVDQQNVYGFGVKNLILNTSDNSNNNRYINNFKQTFAGNKLRVSNYYYADLSLKGSPVTTKGYFLKSTNGGQAWRYFAEMPAGVDYLYAGVFLNSTTGFASAITQFNSYNKSGIVKTTNGGLNWNYVSPADSFQNYREMVFPNSTTGIAVGEHLDTNAAIPFKGLIIRTTNAGNSWIRTKFPGINNFTGISFANSTTGIACGTSNDNIAGAHYYKTTNAGLSWFKLLFQQDTAFADGINLVEGTGKGFAFGTKLEEDPQIPGNFIVVGYFINRTTDYGQTWHKAFFPDPEGTLINSSDIDQNTWYISGGNFFTEKGIVLKTTNGGGPIGIIPISTEIPTVFKVSQNYPNPFNPVTNIRFDLPKEREVSFLVYDDIGRAIYFIKENINAGVYEISFNASELPSGVYFYTVSTGDFKETKKMIFLK